MDHEQHYTLQLNLDKAAVSNMLQGNTPAGLELLAAVVEHEAREGTANFLAKVLADQGVDVGPLDKRHLAELLLRDARARRR